MSGAGENSETINSELYQLASRLNVLRGDWAKENVHVWEPPRRKLVLYISSSLRDTYVERQLLQEKILPELRQSARVYGIDVSIVDGNIGMREGLDQHDPHAWLNCRRELERCRAESGSLLFLSLLGNDYGFRPLPQFIDVAAFDGAIKAIR